jgi:hypothetical protein
VQKTLRDIHEALVESIIAVAGGMASKSVIHACQKLLIPGFVSSGFLFRAILVVYVGASFYLSTNLMDVDIPTRRKDFLDILKIARGMLQIKVSNIP